MTRRRKLAFTALLVLLLLLVAELAVRAVDSARGKLPPVADRSLEYEWDWAAAHLADGRAEFTDSLHQHDPLTGWRLRPGVHPDDVVVNAAGMRADRDYPLEKLAGRRRVLVLGDSFAHGAFVRQHETFTHVLESELLESTDVLNFAVSGFGTDQQVLFYEHYGRPWRSDVVVLAFYVDDYRRNLLTFKTYAKPRFELRDGALALIGSPVQSPQELFDDYVSGRRRIGAPWHRSRLWMMLEAGLARGELDSIDESSEGWRILSALMERFTLAVRADGAQPIWVVIPHSDVESDEYDSRWVPVEELCERRARELDLPCLRLADTFRRALAADPTAPLYRPREIGGHFSARGHRVVAEALAAMLGGLPTR